MKTFDLQGDRLTPVGAYIAQLAPGSRRSQLSALNRISRYLTNDRKGAEAFNWEVVNYRQAAQVRAWVCREFAPSTARRMMAALHQVMRMAWRLELISQDHLARVVDTEPVRGKSAPPGRALRVEELVRLRMACAGDDLAARDRAVIGVLYRAGLRCIEAVRLRLVDVDLEEAVIDVMGKGAKGRKVAIHSELAEDLVAWLEDRGRRNGPLFCAHRSIRKHEMAPITTRAVYALVRKRADVAGLVQVSPHDLRRTCITRMLQLDVDPFTARDVVGHEDVNTTLQYDYRDWDRCREAVGRL